MEPLSSTAPIAMEKNLLQTARDLRPIISQHIEEEENNRRLSKPNLASLKEAGFFRMFLPKSLGGLEADPVSVAKVVEDVAQHNTAAGWSLMVANTSTWWGGGCQKAELRKSIKVVLTPLLQVFFILL